MRDATALARAVRGGRVTAAAAMEAALSAAEADPFGAVVRVEPALGREGAAAADALPQDARGAFHGVPVLAKDLGAAARGLAPCAGAAALRARARDPRADDALFARFRAAGMVPFGLSACAPFGLALTSEPEGAAPARNPWDRGLSPGGSTGGAAAAVASGMVAIAHATDAAGSIRVPAACCGLVGLKPTRGATPMGPGFANWLAGLVGELVLARSVRDVAATFEVAAGDARGPAQEAADRALPERPRVGLVMPVGFAEAERAAARSAAEAAADATGGMVVAMDAECWSALGAGGAGSAVLAASSAEWIDALEISDEELSPLVAAVARAGRAVSGPQIVGALRDMARAAHALWGLFDEVDAIVSPVLADGPPEVGAFDFGSDDVAAHFAKMAAVAPGAGLANATGAPALVLPFGMAGGLPRGVQVMAPPGADRALLGLAAKIEAAAGPLPFPAIAGAPA